MEQPVNYLDGWIKHCDNEPIGKIVETCCKVKLLGLCFMLVLMAHQEHSFYGDFNCLNNIKGMIR